MFRAHPFQIIISLLTYVRWSARELWKGVTHWLQVKYHTFIQQSAMKPPYQIFAIWQFNCLDDNCKIALFTYFSYGSLFQLNGKLFQLKRNLCGHTSWNIVIKWNIVKFYRLSCFYKVLFNLKNVSLHI